MQKAQWLFVALLLAAAWSVCAAQETKRLSVTAMGEPEPPLRYYLLPAAADQQPGDAAPAYLRAVILTAQVPDEEDAHIHELLDAPLGELPREQAGQIIAAFSGAIHEVEVGARRQRCDWDLDRSEGFQALLPDLSHYRRLARVLELKARLHIAAGEYDEAVSTVQTLFALARSISQAPTLIHGLVGIAVAQLGANVLDELVQAPGAPNLYWALAALPHPLVTADTGLDAEKNVLAFLRAELRDPLAARLSPDGWRDLAVSVGRTWGMEREDALRAAAGLAALSYTDAKAYLVGSGLSPDEAEAMPVLQVVAAYLMGEYDRVAQDLLKWRYVPYPQAAEHLQRAQAAIPSPARSVGGVLPTLVLPAVGRVIGQPLVLERRLAALRCVEAARMYAAAHGGALPSALDAQLPVPAPRDPLTDEPFRYEVADGVADLAMPAYPDLGDRSAVHYQITIVQ